MQVAFSLSNLAILHTQQGDYAKAQPLYERALKVFELNFGPSDTNVAHTLTDLAVLHLEQVCLLHSFVGTCPKLALCSEPSLEPKNSTRPFCVSVHPLLQRMDLLRDLLCHPKAFLAWYHIPPELPYLCICWDPSECALMLWIHLSGLLQGNVETGRPLLERALLIQEKALGSDHPDVIAIKDVLEDGND